MYVCKTGAYSIELLGWRFKISKIRRITKHVEQEAEQEQIETFRFKDENDSECEI